MDKSSFRLNSNNKITIICTDEQRKNLEEFGCIACCDEICDCNLCDKCVYDTDNIDFKINDKLNETEEPLNSINSIHQEGSLFNIGNKIDDGKLPETFNYQPSQNLSFDDFIKDENLLDLLNEKLCSIVNKALLYKPRSSDYLRIRKEYFPYSGGGWRDVEPRDGQGIIDIKNAIIKEFGDTEYVRTNGNGDIILKHFDVFTNDDDTILYIEYEMPFKKITLPFNLLI